MVVLLAVTAPVAVQGARDVYPLDPLKRERLHAAGVGGTGCYWMRRANGPVLFAMAEDKAVASIDGRLTVLSPDRGARDLFPFTFDRWRRGDLAITVRKVAVARRIGTETLGGRTDLVLVRSARRTVLHGTMECGS